MKNCGMLLILALIITVVSGCYESPAVAVHQPGVYKGATDPLLAKQRSDHQLKMLRERLTQIQTDR